MVTTLHEFDFSTQLSIGQKAEEIVAEWWAATHSGTVTKTSDTHQGSCPWDLTHHAQFVERRIEVKLEAGARYRFPDRDCLFFELAETHDYSTYRGPLPTGKPGEMKVGECLQLVREGVLKPAGLTRAKDNKVAHWVHCMGRSDMEALEAWVIHPQLQHDRIVDRIMDYPDRGMAVVRNKTWHGYGITLSHQVLKKLGIRQTTIPVGGGLGF